MIKEDVKFADFIAICEKGMYPQTAKMCPENIGNGKLTINKGYVHPKCCWPIKISTRIKR